MVDRVRRRVRVAGVVQGVGFRPFTHALASRLGLGGHVGNDGHGVFIDVEGPAAKIEVFLGDLRDQAPPMAVVDGIDVVALPPLGVRGFRIVLSRREDSRSTFVPPDSATCTECLRELTDRADRRFAHPFANCTHCGPRFTIVRDIPYDRPATTMSDFGMCPACAAEYDDPVDRRFHAQPVCCPACGPALNLSDAAGAPIPGDPIAAAAQALRRGEVLAVKGIGGFHLAVDARAEAAVAELRARKHRSEKPFAVMVPSVREARRLCAVDEAAERVLSSWRAPIVLLDRLESTGLAPSVAPGNRQLGVLVAYTPMHHLLLREFAGPIVLTSGNVSDEPICHEDAEVLGALSGIADEFLGHDREIHIRADDSVVRMFRGRPMPLRRSRGYVPEPVRVPWEFPHAVLACGAELKSTFALARGREVFVSQHIGDLENFETLRSFRAGIEHFRKLFGIDPQVVAHDLHPEYLSTKHAQHLLETELVPDIELIGVQHHHAHIAACLADNEEAGPVLGVAFDGLGFGTDGTMWGGEFLIADLAGFQRAAHLEPVAMPGGRAAILQPWRMAAAFLRACPDLDGPEPELAQRRQNWRAVTELAGHPELCPRTSSAGRLFDAVAALLGVREQVGYEGQAAIELEQLADPGETGELGEPPGSVVDGGKLVLRSTDLVRSVVTELRAGIPAPSVAARFHNSVARLIAETCSLLRESTGLSSVALSGGVFQNALLLNRAVTELEHNGFRVLVHSRVPANDGGISLGQAVVAGARIS
ncbi:carbamoyltransferase HypF [Saccharopolyspora sp. SCSIO 74807]|uniref:carbamoyltransferase HypF n=1 Tax=Saccharopolyspora sp. SCSIO 74807 TaxID=3118084 RepID=UPI0030CD6AD4